MKTKRESSKKSEPKPGPRKLVDAAYLARLEAAARVLPRSRGRQVLADPRTPSHIPLNTPERKKLQDAAAAMGMPYATWARTTLLVVADWPATMQPIRLGSACRGGGALEEIATLSSPSGDEKEPS